MSTFLDYSYDRRNNPCNFCRLRRRKCDCATPICGRCRKLGKTCVYLQRLPTANHEPAQEQPPIYDQAQTPPQDILEAFQRLGALEDEVAAMRKLLTVLSPKNVEMHLEQTTSLATTDSCSVVRLEKSLANSLAPTRAPTKLQNEEENVTNTNYVAMTHESSVPIATLVRTLGWEVTFSRSGFRIHTSIHNFQDLIDFTDTSLRILLANERLHPLPKVSVDKDSSVIFKKKIVSIFWIQFIDILQHNSSSINRAIPHPSPTVATNFYTSVVTKLFVDNVIKYYTVDSSSFQILHPSVIHLLYDADDPFSSPAFCAIAACVSRGYGYFSSTNNKPNKLLSPELTSDLFERACDLLCDSMFDEPNLINLVALCFCDKFAMLNLHVERAWHFRGLGIRIAFIMMQSQYCGMLLTSQGDSPFPRVSLAEWETFKRTCWVLVLVDLCLQKYEIAESTISAEIVLSMQAELGFPEPLDDEKEEAGHAITILNSILKWVLTPKPFHTNADHITLREITEAEQRVHDWYASLPSELRMTTGKINTTDDVAELDLAKLNHFTNSMLLQYHYMFLCIHEQLLPSFLDPDADHSETSLRSHRLCTRSAHLIVALYQQLPFDFVWHIFLPVLLKACDVHYRNTRATDPVVRAEAKRAINIGIVLARSYDREGLGKLFDARVSGTLIELGIEF